MRRPPLVLFASVIMLLSACSDDAESARTTTTISSTAETTTASTTTTTASTVQRQPADATAFFSIEEVGIDPDGWVALNNFTDVDVTLDGLHVCQRDDCFELPDETVEAGQTAYLVTGEAPDVDGIIISGATFGSIEPLDGEFALYVDDPSDPDSIIAYLEWGSTPHTHTEAAIASGLWPEGSYAPTGADAIRLYRNTDSGLWLWDARP